MPGCSASLLCLNILLLCGLQGGWVLSVCPTVCSCSRGHRVVDCSSRGLTKLPPGLQHNIRFLNLSFNRWGSAIPLTLKGRFLHTNRAPTLECFVIAKCNKRLLFGRCINRKTWAGKCRFRKSFLLCKLQPVTRRQTWCWGLNFSLWVPKKATVSS